LIRLLRLAFAVWVLRWASQQFASYVTRHRPRTQTGDEVSSASTPK